MVDENKKDLISQIQKEFPKLSKGQKLIAQYIIDNYDKAAFMTASKLANKVGVSESTVVRFANALNFEGYPQLQKGLEEIIKTKLTTVQRVEMASEYSDEGAILKKVLKADIDNIRNTLEKIDYDVFQQVVDKVCHSETIYIVALRSSTALADYLGFYLNLVLDNVKIVNRGISNMFEQMLRISDKDLVIGIGFPRYSVQTLDALNYAKEQGATVVALTDSLISPLASMADYPLIAKSNMASFVDSLVAPLSLINALVVAVGMREKDKITEYFNKLEDIWEKYNVYERKDQN
ncbi:MurR/RpiR family transcriptional regulator [Alkaliphilus oremlandii]|uniref:Transcriptional regulator, RpiR family n=1 Tax=Alkaliphilus oremlandii (strain OhILAs) TaxID=350688 RepID=A8MFE8_ALKOO|nr:MurR/RpiR family transcriptional regulator [Alkaliphilus oremlandii]ABW19111.1 transcriptional regulator, RpiR family [Alkaliphilus oremlandii OhILAs]